MRHFITSFMLSVLTLSHTHVSASLETDLIPEERLVVVTPYFTSVPVEDLDITIDAGLTHLELLQMINDHYEVTFGCLYKDGKPAQAGESVTGDTYDYSKVPLIRLYVQVDEDEENLLVKMPYDSTCHDIVKAVHAQSGKRGGVLYHGRRPVSLDDPVARHKSGPLFFISAQ